MSDTIKEDTLQFLSTEIASAFAAACCRLQEGDNEAAAEETKRLHILQHRSQRELEGAYTPQPTDQ